MIEGVLSHFVTYIYSKVRSPPYCCDMQMELQYQGIWNSFNHSSKIIYLMSFGVSKWKYDNAYPDLL